MYCKRGREYYGSAKWEGYGEIVNEEKGYITVEILDEGEYEEYHNLVDKERYYQEINDVVRNPKYFNRALAMVNDFSMPGYTIFKHKDYPDKIVRLHVNDPKVLDGTFVGITTGRVMTESELERRRESLTGENNPFYGREHTKETKKLLSEANSGKTLSKEARRKIGDVHFGKPKSKEQRRKMSKSNEGYITLKCEITGDCVRVRGDEVEKYRARGYKNTFQLALEEGRISRGCCCFCKKEFFSWRLGEHVTKCRSNPERIIPPYELRKMKLGEEKRRFNSQKTTCKYCGGVYTNKGLKIHLKSCKGKRDED